MLLLHIADRISDHLVTTLDHERVGIQCSKLLD
jgi:hypothetical protein